MKRNKDFIADQIAGEYVAVPIGEMSKAFHLPEAKEACLSRNDSAERYGTVYMGSIGE